MFWAVASDHLFTTSCCHVTSVTAVAKAIVTNLFNRDDPSVRMTIWPCVSRQSSFTSEASMSLLIVAPFSPQVVLSFGNKLYDQVI